MFFAHSFEENASDESGSVIFGTSAKVYGDLFFNTDSLADYWRNAHNKGVSESAKTHDRDPNTSCGHRHDPGPGFKDAPDGETFHWDIDKDLKPLIIGEHDPSKTGWDDYVKELNESQD